MNHQRNSSASKEANGKPKFAKVALIGKYQAAGSANAVEELAGYLEDEGCTVYIEEETYQHASIKRYPPLAMTSIGQSCDLAIVIGGDGTMLSAGRQMARYGVPLIGVNQGRLGFMTDVRFKEYRGVISEMLRGRYEEDPRTLIEASIWRQRDRVFHTVAMNDVVVNRTSAGMVELRIEVGGHFVAKQRADGLIIATPTGSTAYALSAGGPLLHPTIDGWIMVPIAPHTLSNRPIVLPSKEEISIEIVGGKEISANFDMQTFTSLNHGDCIKVSQAAHKLRLLHPVGWSHYDTLRNKLHWNEDAVGPKD
jgi:NAD+ kinase